MLHFSMVWYLNKHANFYFFHLCARLLHSLALLTPRHSWMTHSRMNQPSQIQTELFLACPLRSFGVCLHSPRMLKHQHCCGSWDWHGQSKLEGRVEERQVRSDRGMVQWIGEGSYRKSSEQKCEAISIVSVWAFCSSVLPHSRPRCKVNSFAVTMMDISHYLSPVIGCCRIFLTVSQWVEL